MANNRRAKEDIEEELQLRADRAARALADRIIDVATSKLVEQEITVSGTRGLLGSDYVEKVESGKYRAGFDASYAPFVEFGTDPHMPPPEPIKEWLQDRIRGGQIEPIQTWGENEGWSVNNLDQATFLIQKKIANEGTMPQPFLRPSKMQVRENAQQIVEQELDL